MLKPIRLLAVASVLALAATTAVQAASIRPFGLTLGNGGSALVTIDDLGNPGAVRSRSLTDGTAPVSLDALAYRPQTDQLYGYQTGTNSVFLVDAGSGMAQRVASTGDGVGGASVGFDFNNTIDAARLVSTNGDNLVFDPKNAPPTINRFTPLFYDAGDRNAAVTPRIFANAYMNQVPNAASTVQYVLDAATNSLATLGNNAGNLQTVGQLTVNGRPLEFSDTGGFDIFSRAEGDNTAYALLTTTAGQGLYLVDLTAAEDGSVAATFLGAAGGGSGLEGLAVAPVPLPAGAWLMIAGIAAFGAARHRARKAAV